jgi:hypothetical protein
LRAVAVGETVVVAGSERFLVLAPPTVSLAGAHAFVITGFASVALGGRLRLVTLVVDDGCTA